MCKNKNTQQTREPLEPWSELDFKRPTTPASFPRGAPASRQLGRDSCFSGRLPGRRRGAATGCDALFPERARPLASEHREAAGRPPEAAGGRGEGPAGPGSRERGGSRPGCRAGGPGSREVIPSRIQQGVPAPTSRRLLGRHGPPSPRVCSGGGSRRRQRGGPPRPPPPRAGRLASSRAPLLALEVPGAGQRGRQCRGAGLVIACSGTMLTFEPLTTKQTTLVLLLHCPNRVY